MGQRSVYSAYARIDKQASADQSMFKHGRWTKEEHFRFLEALKRHGKEWKRVQEHVGTRTSTQARSHAQKFLVKLEKKQYTLETFLEDLDLNKIDREYLMSDCEDDDGVQS